MRGALGDTEHEGELDVRVGDDEKRTAARMLDAARCDTFVELDTGHDWSEGQRDVDTVRFLHDPLVSVHPASPHGMN